jgi:hypothetical protein
MSERRSTNIYAMRLVQYRLIEDYLSMGWIAPPQRFDHKHHYGISMLWICSCPIPDLTKDPYPHES